MRARAVVGLFLVLTVPAFVGGMLTAQRLIESTPTTVPVLLAERPAPPVDYDYNSIPLFAVKPLMRWADITGTPIWVMAKTGHWESGDNPGYRSRQNENGSYDYGYVGLNSYSLPWFSVTYNAGVPINPFDVDQSVMVAAKWMHDLYEEKGDWRLVVGSWNAGPNTPPSRWKPTTIRHIKAILGGAQ